MRKIKRTFHELLEGLPGRASLGDGQGNGGRVRGERGPRSSPGRRAAQDRGGPRLQRHGRSRAELAHLHIQDYTGWRCRQARWPQTWRSAALGQWGGKLPYLETKLGPYLMLFCIGILVYIDENERF